MKDDASSTIEFTDCDFDEIYCQSESEIRILNILGQNSDHYCEIDIFLAKLLMIVVKSS